MHLPTYYRSLYKHLETFCLHICPSHQTQAHLEIFRVSVCAPTPPPQDTINSCSMEEASHRHSAEHHCAP